MIETAFVFDTSGRSIYWHEPPDRSAGAIPDSRDLWDVLWDNREVLGGVAHTHPWHCEPFPSGTDLTTFAAVEAGLGKRLVWPIATLDMVGYYVFNPDLKKYIRSAMPIVLGIDVVTKDWKHNIRRLIDKSHGGEHA